MLDEYSRVFPDVYRISRNGDERFAAIVQAIREHIGECDSILDISCHEGYALQYAARNLAAHSVIGLDISRFVLEKACIACSGLEAKFHQFDLTDLYSTPTLRLPVSEPCDVVLVSEILYYVGPHAHYLWSAPSRDLNRKIAFVRALQGYARKSVVLQHFGKRERGAIELVARACGGRMVDEHWGIYLLDGLGGQSAAQITAGRDP